MMGHLGAAVVGGSRFNSIEAIGQIKCPTIFFHGICDEICPVSHSHELFEASGAETKVLKCFPDVDHETIFLDRYLDAQLDILRQALPLKNSSARPIYLPAACT